MCLVLMRVNSRVDAEAYGTFKYTKSNPLSASFRPRCNSKLALADFASRELVDKRIWLCERSYHCARRQ
jgi:hypothetical protein